MAVLRFRNVGIRAIASCVPADVSRNAETLRGIIPDAEIEKTISAVGIREKRIAPPDVCASDLCVAAAEKLFADNPDVSRESIGVLLFMSQTGDFRIPATAPLVQTRLGLSSDCACMDVSLGCSGYVYALSAAFAYAANLGASAKILLLAGETFSKIVNPKDRVNAPLYGDAGTATLIENSSDFCDSFFILKTDGRGEDAVKIPAGACRIPASPDRLRERADKDGAIRADSEVFMDGMEVFNSALRRVPEVVREIFALAGTSAERADVFVFHQANKMLTDFIAHRLKIPLDKVPYSLDEYGNTSSASIPLTISARLASARERKSAVLCGFGAGFSWGAAALSLASANISPVVDFPQKKLSPQ